jgi:hypothetical protein
MKTGRNGDLAVKPDLHTALSSQALALRGKKPKITGFYQSPPKKKILNDSRRYRKLHQVQVHRLRGRLPRGLLP